MFPAFIFTTPAAIVYGWGALRQLPELAAARGRRPALLAGGSLRRSGRLDALLHALRAAGLEPRLLDPVPPEPTVAQLQAALDQARAAEPDSVIAIGGGSVLDTGKAVGALARAEGTAADYFAGLAVPATGLPVLACPTTAGTGAEVTRAVVFSDPEHRRKASFRGEATLPAVALVDPELTLTCPPRVTAGSGLDALAQAVEAYVSRGANPLTDSLALMAARLAWELLPAAWERGDDRPARQGMALAALLGGMALNTARLGLVHGLAHPVGAVTSAAHGVICGLLLPPVVEFNLPAATVKYAVLARTFGLAPAREPDERAAARLPEAFRGLLQRLELPERLAEIGLQAEHLHHVAAEALPSGSTRANPRPVEAHDARAVAAGAL